MIAADLKRLSTPLELQEELEGIRRELAIKSDQFDIAAQEWKSVQPERERVSADAYIAQEGPEHLRRQAGRRAAAKDDWGALEGRYVALKAKLDALQAQAIICQSQLKTARYTG